MAKTCSKIGLLVAPALQGSGLGGPPATLPNPPEGVSVYVKFEFAVLESDLTPYEKLAWCAIASFNGFARLNPTEAQISKRCRVSPRQVRRAIKKLQEVGLIGRNGREFFLIDVDQWALKEANQTTNKAQQTKKVAHQSPSIDRSQIVTQKRTPSASQAQLVVDPRHDQVKRMIFAVYKLNNGEEPPWNGRTGSVLKTFLDSVPAWSTDQIGACIAAFFISETNTAAAPHVWIPELASYLNGPLDRFKKHMEGKYDGIERAAAKLSALDGADVSAKTGI